MDTLCSDLLNLIVPILKTSELHCLRLNEPDSSVYSQIIRTTSKIKLAFKNHDYHYILETWENYHYPYKLALAIEFNVAPLIEYYFNLLEASIDKYSKDDFIINIKVAEIALLHTYTPDSINSKYITYLLITAYKTNNQNLVDRIDKLFPKLGPHTNNIEVRYWYGYHGKEYSTIKCRYYQGLLDGSHYDLFVKMWTSHRDQKFKPLCILIVTIENEDLSLELLHRCISSCILTEKNHGTYLDIFISKSKFKIVEMLLMIVKPSSSNILKLFKMNKGHIIPITYLSDSLSSIQTAIRGHASNNRLDQLDLIFDTFPVRDSIIDILWSEFPIHKEYVLQKVHKYYGPDINIDHLDSFYPPKKEQSNTTEYTRTENSQWIDAINNRDYNIIKSREFCTMAARDSTLFNKIIETDCLDMLKVYMVACIGFNLNYIADSSRWALDSWYVHNFYQYCKMNLIELRKGVKRLGLKGAYKKTKINLMQEIATVLC